MVAFFMFGIVAAIESRTIKASLSAGTNHLFRSAGVVLAFPSRDDRRGYSFLFPVLSPEFASLVVLGE